MGVPARPVRHIDMLNARLDDSQVQGVILDLESELWPELLNRIRGWDADNAGQTNPIAVVAFGPHVNTEAFAAARKLGATRVLARGAFAKQLPQILTKLVGGDSGDSGDGGDGGDGGSTKTL